ncbi:hypothetical protein [Marinimicrobium sp. ARAG 43.8]|uniref:hypothetical protein n=1 Tax=Marinimicrobium sp. ARAG 43.8 TaxID=3418719 RepID=UPI003CE7C923
MANAPSQYEVIAGNNAGRPIRCAPEVLPAFKKLQQAALRGNHWARIAVKELSDLTNGQAGKQNVYVRPGKAADHHTPFAVFLPGLKATVYHWTAKGGYTVVDLQLDGHYFEAVSSAEQDRMGLYRAEPRGEEWSVSYTPNGKITPEDGRLITVADGGYQDASRAVRAIVPRAIKHSGVAAVKVRNNGCDLHYTPSGKQLGGLTRYDALTINQTRSSALHLARTMADACHIPNVAWVADKGGSAVLTQAMQILVDQGVALKGHTAYLYKPRTSPGEALLLAHQLNLTLNESFADTGWSLRGAVSQLGVAGARLNNKNDPYNKGYHSQAWINGLVKASGPVGVAAVSVAAVGTPIPIIAGIVTAIGAGGVTYNIGQSLAEDLRHKLNR